MRYGTTTTMAASLMALVAAAPLTAGAADTKAQTTTQEAKTMVTDSWVTAKTKISLFADERVKGTWSAPQSSAHREELRVSAAR